jgi:phosphotriesterase-related protein
MSTVETVRGSIDAAEMGQTLTHEHIFVLDPEALQNYGTVWGSAPYWDEEERVADAIAKLQRLVDGGVRTIFDPTVPGIGRFLPRIQRVNDSVPDLHIIVATGVYAHLALPHFLSYRTDEVIAELFIREIREGINDTGVRAAFLKCVVEEEGMAGDAPRILNAISMASVETGAPVMVHTNSTAKTGLVALETLTKHGVDPTKVVITHAGDSNDLDYLRELADTGASLGFDRFGIEHFNPDDRRVQTLATLVEQGYAQRVLLGHDAACFYDFMVANPFFADEKPDYLHISQRIVPALLGAGVTQEQVDTMLVDNPRRFVAQD